MNNHYIKSIHILLVGVFLFFSCEDKKEKDCAGVEGGNNICGCTDSTAINYDSTSTFNDNNCNYDTTPPTISISSPVSGQTVNEIVAITITTQDNEGISKVEFFIDDSLHFTDTESPYEYNWNTTTYTDTSHTVKVISYDTSDNTTESQPILLIVDNTGSYPQTINIVSINYTLAEMIIIWNQSTDIDFNHYELLVSDIEDGDKTLLSTISEIDNTTLILTDFNPTQPKWYWLVVSDTLGLTTISTGYYVMDEYPIQVELHPVNFYNGSFILQWIQNEDEDFSNYTIEEISYEDTSNVEIIFSTNEREIIEYTIDNIPNNVRKYYKIKVTDYWGLTTSSDLILASSYHKILFTDINQNDLYVIDVDGINERFLTIGSVNEFTKPISTSDGQKIIFEDDGTLYSININGTERIQLTPQYNSIRGMDILNDDSKIVFVAYDKIMIMNVDGTELIQLTDGGDSYPKFSSNGNDIVFQRANDIYIIDINGGNLQQLTDAQGEDKHPEFSPNGSWKKVTQGVLSERRVSANAA